ncbi:aurora kinase A and ninein-interacting protein [Arapaima gigas]
MKGTRRAVAPQEACGVWLDTAELRAKKPKPQVMRPISKLLNPLASSGGYSVAVALNFTQTRMQMPATKQTSISSFFVPQQPKEKTTVSSEPCSDLSLSATCIQVGTKRKLCAVVSEHDADSAAHEDMLHREADRNCEPNVEPSTQAAFQHVLATPEHPPLSDVKCQVEEEGPPRKKKHVRCNFILGRTGIEKTPQQSVDGCGEPEDAHMTESTGTLPGYFFTQDSEGNRVLAHQSTFTDRTKSDGFLLDDLGHEVFWGTLQGDAHTSTQRRQRFPSLRSKKEGKENDPFAGAWRSGSMLGSPLKQTSYSFSSQYSKKGSCLSPRKAGPLCLQEEAGDSYAMLFTQDSQGQRVIAHRSFQPRSPLKDQTNWASCKDVGSRIPTPAFNTLLGEDEDEDLDSGMLFTQDSQGNMVIKH